MTSETIKQAVIRAVMVAIAAALPALLAWLNTPEARDLLGAWYIYVPILTGILSGVLKAFGGPTVQADPVGPAAGPDDVRSRDVRATAKPPNIFAT